MFSIVLPLYNKAHTIKNTLNSVFKQTFQNFEIIIVNDGSSDGGVEIIKNDFKDERLILLEQKNQGVSVARNNGVAISNYDYIAFLDGDDEWDEKYLETMNKAINLFPDAGMFCSGGFYKNFETGEINPRIVKRYENQISKINYFENPHVYTHTSATVVLKKYFNQIPYGFPIGMKNNEDLALFYSIALICDTIYIGYQLSYYCYNVKFQATQVNKENYIDITKRLNITYDSWSSLNKENKNFNIFFKYELRHIIITILRNNDYKNLYILFENLDKNTKESIGSIEINFYKIKFLRKIAILFILTTKIIWRTHGYPKVS